MWWICQKIPTAAIVVVVGLRIVVVSYRRSHGPHYYAQCHSESDVAAQFPHARALKLLESLAHFSEGFTLATLATWFINSGLGISLSTLDVLIQISLRTQVMVEDWYWPHVSQRSGQCHPRRTVCGPQHGWFIWAVNRSYQILNTVFFWHSIPVYEHIEELHVLMYGFGCMCFSNDVHLLDLLTEELTTDNRTIPYWRFLHWND